MGQKKSKIIKKSKVSSTDINETCRFDEKDACHRKVIAGSAKKMLMLRRQSENARKRLDHQKYLAQESPEPIFDVSNCELEEVPSGVYALCKVLQKEVLLLNDNWLNSLQGGGTLTDLISIRVLDLHNNELIGVPNEIGQLRSLQVLNLEHNRLTKLPDSIGQLSCLQTLNVKDNKLKVLPESVCSLKSLRTLDTVSNSIANLPKHLCHVQTLETLAVDVDSMKFPPCDVCALGTEAIMKFLCSECSMEYLPPSNFLLNVLDPPKLTDVTDGSSKVLKDEEYLMKNITDHGRMMEKKRLERIELEHHFAEHQEQQAQLALMAQANRNQMLKMVIEEDNKLDKELDKLSKEKELSRKGLIQDLQAVEQGAEDLIQKLLNINASVKKTEELLDTIEKQRIEEDKLFVVRWEEEQNLRQKEVLNAMQNLLQESEIFELVRQNYKDHKENSLQQALEIDQQMAHAQVESILLSNDIQLSILLKDLAKQEELQKEAFEVLQLSKDVKHKRITNQIALIEEELANLTVVEIEKRGYRVEDEMNRLAEKRIALIELLSTLLDEQDRRQIELRQRLVEMERLREDGHANYWLVQYQRLMDQKPQALIDQEKNLEISVVKILNNSGAEECIPIFARNRISIETLLQMSEGDLKQMGVHELGLRKAIIKQVQQYRQETKEQSPLCTAMSDFNIPSPSAPPLEDEIPSREMPILTKGLNSECSVCLDHMSDVIFLNCGHVCTCMACSESVQQCPLCRANIVRRIKLTVLHV